MPDQPASAHTGSRVDGREPAGGDQPGRPAEQATARSALTTALRIAGSRPVRWTFVAATVGLGGWAIADGWSGVQAALARLDPLAIAGALLCVLAALLANMQIYRVLLAALGSPLPPRTAAQILFVGQLGKYLPGSVWPVLAQMQLGSAHRVPRARSASASVLTMLMSLLSGILVGIVMVPFAGHARPYWWIFLLAQVIGVCMHPRLLNRILNRVLRLARRPALERPLTGRAVAAGLGWGVVCWIFFGLHRQLEGKTIRHGLQIL